MILLILVGVELPLRVVVTILECCVTFSGVKLSIRSFVLLLKYVNSQRRYGFLTTKELIFGFQILDLKDHFSASLNLLCSFIYN